MAKTSKPTARKPAAKAPARKAAAKPALKAAPAKAAKAAEAKASPLVITIKGKGNVPIIADGAMRRVAAGKPVEVNKAELAYLDHAEVTYTKEK